MDNFICDWFNPDILYRLRTIIEGSNRRIKVLDLLCHMIDFNKGTAVTLKRCGWVSVFEQLIADHPNKSTVQVCEIIIEKLE